MSWTNGIPSREEYTMHYLGAFKVQEILSPKTASRVIARVAPLLARLLDLKEEPWASQLKEELNDITNNIAVLPVKVFANGVFTVAILRSKTHIGIGATRKADQDEFDQRYATHLAVRRAFQSLLQQIDLTIRDTDLGRTSLAILDTIRAMADDPDEDEAHDDDETGLVPRPLGETERAGRVEPVGYTLKELAEEKRRLYPDDEIPF